ncbi:hypothetical protein pb186bvf_000487 [Paramecium bursaria]
MFRQGNTFVIQIGVVDIFFFQSQYRRWNQLFSIIYINIINGVYSKFSILIFTVNEQLFADQYQAQDFMFKSHQGDCRIRVQIFSCPIQSSQFRIVQKAKLSQLFV